MADAVQQQPGSLPNTDADADALLDSYLDGVSDTEDTPKKVARKAAKSDGSEQQPPEDDEDADDLPEDEGDDDVEEEDTADDDGAEDDDEDQSQDEAGRFVGQNGRVKLADGTVTTVAELIRGNMREADYTRKTQETGALHQELQTRAADYAQQEKIVALAIHYMANAMPPEPDPAMLEPGEGYDPVGFTADKMRWENASKQLQVFQAAHQQMAAQNQATQSALLKRYANEQKDKLLSYYPELKDRQKLSVFNDKLLRTMSRYGMGPKDLAGVYNADVIRALVDLGEWHSVKAARKAARRKAQGAPVLSPGPRQSPQSRKARANGRDWETLRKTGGKGGAGEAALDRIFDNILS